MNRREVFKLGGAAALAVGLGVPSLGVAQAPATPTSMTLLQMAAQAAAEGKIDASAFIESFAKSSDLLQAMPFMAVSGGQYRYVDEGFLPGMAFLGRPVSNGDGVLNPETEFLKIVGGDLDYDAARPVERRAQANHFSAAMLGRRFCAALVNGNQFIDPRFGQGLKNRIIGHQLIPAGATPGGDALSLALLDGTIDCVDGPTHLLMSKKMRNLLSAASRGDVGDGWLVWDKDEFGERIARYTTQDGETTLPILTTDYDDENRQIIDFNEPSPGGGLEESSSIYVLALDETGVVGLHNGEIVVDDFGLLSDYGVVKTLAPNEPRADVAIEPVSSIYRTRAEWLATLGVMSGRAAARIHGIKYTQVRA